jgi:hypothetical protein
MVNNNNYSKREWMPQFQTKFNLISSHVTSKAIKEIPELIYECSKSL